MAVHEYTKKKDKNKTFYRYAFEVKDATGKRKVIKKDGFSGKKEAERAERRAKNDWDDNKYIDPVKMTYGEYVTKWLENKQDISPETRETNQGHLKNHVIPELGYIPFQQVNVIHIESFVSALQKKNAINRNGKDTGKKLSDGTIKKIFNLVLTSFSDAERKEIIGKNPFNQLGKSDKPKVSKKNFDFWTKDEVKQFFDAIDKINHRQRILFVLAIYTGMRRGEMLGLRWRDIDMKTKRLTIIQTLKQKEQDNKGSRLKKGGKNDNASRSIKLSPYVISELKKHKIRQNKEKLKAEEYHDHDLVVCQENGKPVSVSNFTKFWDRIIEKTQMSHRIKFHELRHTCASLLLSANKHPKKVQALLGHSSIKITLDYYSHLIPDEEDDTMEAIDNILE